ncbi:MAG TPA: hypothetical protein VE011_06405 [Candidatus Dormibacteraeota bacterium]|nr:hypothetical protein [Candidatus Dormibacteraeota bacterium]
MLPDELGVEQRVDRHCQRDDRCSEPEPAPAQERCEGDDPDHVLDREDLARREEDQHGREGEHHRGRGRDRPAPCVPPADPAKQAEPDHRQRRERGQPRVCKRSGDLDGAEPERHVDGVPAHQAGEHRQPAADRLDLEPALRLVRQESERVRPREGHERHQDEHDRPDDRDPVSHEPAGVERHQPWECQRGHDRQRIQLRQDPEADGDARRDRAPLQREPQRDHHEQGGVKVEPERDRERRPDRDDDQTVGHRRHAVALAARDAATSHDPREHDRERKHQRRLPGDEQPGVSLDRELPERPEQVRDHHRHERQRRVLEGKVAVGDQARGERMGLLEVQPDVALVRVELARRRQCRGNEDHQARDDEPPRKLPRERSRDVGDARSARRRHGASLPARATAPADVPRGPWRCESTNGQPAATAVRPPSTNVLRLDTM